MKKMVSIDGTPSSTTPMLVQQLDSWRNDFVVVTRNPGESIQQEDSFNLLKARQQCLSSGCRERSIPSRNQGSKSGKRCILFTRRHCHNYDGQRPLPLRSRLEDGPACVCPRPIKVDFNEESGQGCDEGREKYEQEQPQANRKTEFPISIDNTDDFVIPSLE